MNQAKQKRQASAVTPNLAAIASHPTRLKSWFLLAERTLSPKEIAAEIDQPVTHVAYHVRQLLTYGAIELVKTEPRRGATEHWYRSVTRPDMRAEDMEGLTKDQAQANAGHIATLQVADATSSLEAGLMADRPDHVVIRSPMNLDAQAFTEMRELLDETLDSSYKIYERCIDRTEGDPEKRDVAAMAHLNLFEMPPSHTRRTVLPANGGDE